MPTITADSVLDSAQLVLVDPTEARWTRAELFAWLNAGLRQIAVHRPDAVSVTTTMQLVSGTKQSLPAAATALLDVVRNVGGRPIRKTSALLLDQQCPTWHTATSAATRNYTYDPRTPRIFYVYPPAVADAEVEIKYQTMPSTMTDQNAVLPIDDSYANALLDYVLYRAFTKDAEYNSSGDRAAAHKAAFEAALGVKTQADSAAAPVEKAEV